MAAHLLLQAEKYSPLRNRVAFHHKEAGSLEEIADGTFDHAIASQVFHWFRKEKGEKSGPNLEYERRAPSLINKALKTDGTFAFSTGGCDFRCEDLTINERHFMFHPFYVAFREALAAKLGIPYEKNHTYTFDYDEIRRLMDENGFEVIDRGMAFADFPPHGLIEICLVGTQMQVFQKQGLQMSMEDRERLLLESIDDAFKTCKPEDRPVMGLSAQFLARKK